MTDWTIIAVRLGLYVSLALAFGLAAFALYGMRMDDRSEALPLRSWLATNALVALLLSFAWVALMASSMAGTPAWPIDWVAVEALTTGSSIGLAWKVRMAALVLGLLAALFVRGGAGPILLVAIASGVALATLAWTGHGAVDEGLPGWAHLIADILHLLAAGAWVGALAGLILLVLRPASRVSAAHLQLTHSALHGFGTMGTVIVGTIVLSGLVNSWLLVGLANVSALGTTLYGLLLLAKLALFGAMLGFAALNRFRLTPAFEHAIARGDHSSAAASLRRSLAAETTCVLVILFLVAWLGMLSPPASGG
jgi:copper resistance protein D